MAALQRRSYGGSENSLHEPTGPQPLPGEEQNGGRPTAVPLLGGVRGGFMVPMRDVEIVRTSQEPSSGTSVSPVRIETETHRRDARATTVALMNRREHSTFNIELSTPQARPNGERWVFEVEC